MKKGKGGTTILHTHGSTTSREAQPYVTLMAVPLTVASFLLLIAVSAATSIALSWRCCGDFYWEVRKWKGLDQGAIMPSSITTTISPNKLHGQQDRELLDGSDSNGAAYFLSTAISQSFGHRCDALGITVGVHEHDDLSVLPCTCTDFPGLHGSQIPHHFHQLRAHQSLHLIPGR